MAARSLTFFMMPRELRDIVRSASTDLGFVVKGLTGGHLEAVNVAQIGTEECPNEVYLEEGTLSDQPEEGALRDLRRVVLRVPGRQGDVLYLSELAAKSDWLDSSTGQVVRCSAGLVLFDALKKRIKPHLRYPTWARNIMIAGSSTRYRDVGHTEAVRVFSEGGGVLMQEGVLNARFTVAGVEAGAE